ncbi:MAG: C4-dicarboxylate-specific signal transduction histidine kinase, partial [Myxococcota bacterium]
EAELEALRNQLVRVERLATLGTLAGGVGHELNNILTVFLGAMHFVRERARRGEAPLDSDLDQLDAAGRHIAAHARHLLSLARPGPDYAEAVDLSEVLRGTLGMLDVAGRTRGIEMVSHLPAARLPVRVNRTCIEQVLVNLISNAADAMQPGSLSNRIDITLHSDQTGRIRCSVADNGTGIPIGHLEDIFSAYFTTKSADKGTGLGLPVVKRIVEQYGGTLSVTSAMGAGTTFSFDLPMAEETAFES